MAVRSFFFGFVTAAALAGGGYYYYLQKPDADPCRVCSTGTKCAAGLCVVAVTPPQPVPKKRVWRRGSTTAGTTAAGSSGSSGNTGSPPPLPGIEGPSEAPQPSEPPPPPPPPLRPEEKRLVAVGDKLTGTEVLNLAEAQNGAERELSQEDIDAVFRPKQGAIIGCIDDARGEAQLDGQITVAFRIRRSGDVAGVRVEAPAYLINHGLLDCCRRIVSGLRFPLSTKAQIVTYPFSLH